MLSWVEHERTSGPGLVQFVSDSSEFKIRALFSLWVIRLSLNIDKIRALFSLWVIRWNLNIDKILALFSLWVIRRSVNIDKIRGFIQFVSDSPELTFRLNQQRWKPFL